MNQNNVGIEAIHLARKKILFCFYYLNEPSAKAESLYGCVYMCVYLCLFLHFVLLLELSESNLKCIGRVGGFASSVYLRVKILLRHQNYFKASGGCCFQDML